MNMLNKPCTGKLRTLRNKRVHMNQQIRIKMTKKSCMNKSRTLKMKTAAWVQ
jgi:hypothetical protein